jgi:hypothetical protein
MELLQQRPVVENRNLEEPDYDLYKFNFIMKHANGILKIDDNTEKKLETSITYDRKEKSVEFVMKPKSTLLVGSTYNQAHGFEIIQWSLDSTNMIKISASDLQRSGGLFPPFHFYYDIKAKD